MSAFRRLLTQRHLALLICAAALLLKLVVPTGYMIGTARGHLAITLCPGAGPVMTMAMPGVHSAMPDHGKADHGKADMPCTFAGLSAAALGATDPILLVALIVFITAIARRPTAVPRPSGYGRFRPPLRGPPAV